MIRSWLATLFLLGLSAWLADTGPRPMLGADKTDPKKADAVQAQGSQKAPSAKATDAHKGHHGGGQSAHHHAGAKDGHAKAPKATADGKCPYCHQTLAAKGQHKGHKGQKAHHGKCKKGHHGKGHKGHHGKAGFGHHGKCQKGHHGHHGWGGHGHKGHHGKAGFGHHGQKGHHGKCQKGHHGKAGFGHKGHGQKGHHGKAGFGHKGHGQKGHHGKAGFGHKGHGQKGHHGKCQKGHHGKAGFGHHGKKGHHGKCQKGPHGKAGFGHHGKKGHQGKGHKGQPGKGGFHVLMFRGPAGGFHPPFAPGMAPKMPSADELFKMFDTNGDGKIDKAEFAAGLKKIREKMQQRMQAFGPQASRGKLAPPAGPKKGPQAKQAPGGPHAGPPHKMPSVAEIFAKLDKNKDGKLTQDEVPARMWEHLSKAGVVKNGAVTKEALEAFHKKMMDQRAKEKAAGKAKPKT